MANFWTLLLIVSIFIGSQCVSGQSSDSISSIQAYWNQLCADGSTTQGCGTSAINPSSTGVSSPAQPIRDFIINRPTTTPPSRFPSLSPPSSHHPPSSSVGCPPNQKRCPQLQSTCISKSFDCNLLPSNYGCPRGQKRCNEMPNCIPNHVDCRTLNSDISCHANGETGVVCDDSTAVVIREDCGRILHTKEHAPIHRLYPWVRAIYKGGQPHCTATLVSSSAVVTAAHCLTRSLVSNEADPNSSNYELELTGPDFRTPRIKLKAESLHIHPLYKFNNNNPQYDLGVIFFDFTDNYKLPIVCIVDQPYISPHGKKQLVFSLHQDKGQQTEDGGENIDLVDIRVGGFSTPLPSPPSWKSAEASWDFTCKTTSNQNNAGCVDQVQVDSTQFCATHEGVSMRGGSSGGPYLIEVGDGVEEVWVLMGVLSSFSNDSSCMQDHTIYSQVADDTKWVKNCALEERC